MPRIPANDLVEFRVRLTRQQRERLEHHSKHLGLDMTDIVRIGVAAQLELLDEKEMLALEAKRAKSRQGAFVPSPPQHRWGTPPGLGEKKPMPIVSFLSEIKATEVSVPKKVKDAFRRWAEYIEDAEDRSDGERRVAVVMEDMYEKCANDAEKTSSYDAFKIFLEERKVAMTKPSGIVNVGDIPVAGDVD